MTMAPALFVFRAVPVPPPVAFVVSEFIAFGDVVDESLGGESSEFNGTDGMTSVRRGTRSMWTFLSAWWGLFNELGSEL